jgi:hypothetical protein
MTKPDGSRLPKFGYTARDPHLSVSRRWNPSAADIKSRAIIPELRRKHDEWSHLSRRPDRHYSVHSLLSGPALIVRRKDPDRHYSVHSLLSGPALIVRRKNPDRHYSVHSLLSGPALIVRRKDYDHGGSGSRIR